MFAGLWLIATSIFQGVQTRVLSGVTLVVLFGLIWLLLAGSAFRRQREERAAVVEPAKFVLWNHAGAVCLIAIILAAGMLPAKVIERSLHNASLISGLVVPAPAANGE